MTQQADPRFPMIDTGLDAETTAPSGITVPAQNSGWPPSPPAAPFPTMPAPAHGSLTTAAEPPLNTLAWVSVVAAFVVSPVAVVLGLVARRQIARTGERGRGLALVGTILGAVFSLVGIATTIVVLVLASQVSATIAATAAPSAAPASSAPVAPPAAARPSAPAAAPGSGSNDDSAGRAQVGMSFLQVGAAAQQMSDDLDQHSGDLDAMQGDFARYRTAIQAFRDDATSAQLSPATRAQVDRDLVPAVDRVLADLDVLSSSSSQSRLTSAADALQTDSSAMVGAAQQVIGG